MRIDSSGLLLGDFLCDCLPHLKGKSMSAFSVGDVVQLNSGGPKMTVSTVIGAEGNPQAIDVAARNSGLKNGDVICVWFEDTEKKSSFFPVSTLKRHKASKLLFTS